MPKACKPSKRKISLLLVYILFLLGTSLVPMDRKIEGLQFLLALKPALQNLLHIPLFMLLSILWLQVLQNYKPLLRSRIILALILSCFIGIFTEYIQIFVPGRYPSVIDMGFNTLGAMLGIAFYAKLERSSESLIKRLVCE
jgi:glycopeptide antibiotics resistance protein